MHLKTIHEIRDLLRKKEVTALEVTENSLKRINEIDDKLGAFISIEADKALEAAREVDKKLQTGEILPDLAGIPMALKDNMCMKGTISTCSSRMMEGFLSPYDATVVQRLKANGAVIVGKANMDEFAMGSSTETSAFKLTKKPIRLGKSSWRFIRRFCCFSCCW